MAQEKRVADFQQSLTQLVQHNVAVDTKLSLLQEISDNFEGLSGSSNFSALLENLLTAIVKLLGETQPVFISENPTQKLRKLMLELTNRCPMNDSVRPFQKNLSTLMFNIIKTDNEENVMIALRIVGDLQKSFRPPFSTDVDNFLRYCKELFTHLPQLCARVFVAGTGEPISVVSVRSLVAAGTSSTIAQNMNTAYIATVVKAQGHEAAEQGAGQCTLLPNGSNSLRVLAELPSHIVLIYQLYRDNRTVSAEIADFIPMILKALELRPKVQASNASVAIRQLHVDLLQMQIKSLTLIAFMAKLFTDIISLGAASLIKSIVNLFDACPNDMPMLRREALIACRHLTTTDFRSRFVPQLQCFFDENCMIGSGWTANEVLRPLLYTILVDLVHHVRTQLPWRTVDTALYAFARCLHDVALPAYARIMCAKVMMNMCDQIVSQRAERDQASEQGSMTVDLLRYMLEVFIRKFKLISKHHLPAIMERYSSGAETGATQSGAVQSASASASNTDTQVEDSQKDKKSEEKIDQSMSAEAPCSTASGAPVGSSTASAPASNEGTPSGAQRGNRSASPSTGGENDSQGDQNNEGGELADGKKLSAEDAHKEGMGLDSTAPATPKKVCSQFWGQSGQTWPVQECRNLVRTLVGGVKSIVWALAAVQGQAAQGSSSCCLETRQAVRLLKYALPCLDIYTITLTPSGTFQRGAPTANVRTKEEKETLDHFASVFSMLQLNQFKEIFSMHIDMLVERISSNYALQLVCNYFLVNSKTSSAFGSILLQYLVDRQHVMGRGPDGGQADRGVLHLKLFKLVFNSVSQSAQLGLGTGENELMLKPHLHAMVHGSMELALTAKEPLNYFLLLRQLFRSIGGGNHDILYQEFLPLLPALLRRLNRLQASWQRAQMRELFVELCLTVPVRLSSLLPYLPLLMEPLVCALNGGAQLVQQGLRTLELCVDNLQPDYLFERMEPARAKLMQALWRTVAQREDETAAKIAFRILAKFGGSNRKMLAEPQTLHCASVWHYARGTLCVDFAHTDQQASIQCSMSAPPVSRMAHANAEHAQSTSAAIADDGTISDSHRIYCCAPPAAAPVANVPSAKLPLTDAVMLARKTLNSNEDYATRKAAWKFIKSVFMAGFKSGCPDEAPLLNEWASRVMSLLEQRRQAGGSLVVASAYNVPNLHMSPAARKMYVNAVTAMLFAVWWEDLRVDVMPFFNAVIRNLTLCSVLEHTSTQSSRNQQQQQNSATAQDYHMDPSILVDALKQALGDHSKEFCHSAVLAVTLIYDTATAALNSSELASRLPLFDYLLDQFCVLCLKPAFYARLGACTGLRFLMDKMPHCWLRARAQKFLSALFCVLRDQYCEVSAGALDMAKGSIVQLVRAAVKGMSEEPPKVQPEDEMDANVDADSDAKSLRTLCESLMQELVPVLASPIDYVAQQAWETVGVICTESKISVTDLFKLVQRQVETLVASRMANFASYSMQMKMAFIRAFHQLTTKTDIITFDSDNDLHVQFCDEMMSLLQSDSVSMLRQRERSLLTLASGVGAYSSNAPAANGAAGGGALHSGAGGSVIAQQITDLKIAALEALTTCYLCLYDNHQQTPVDDKKRTKRDQILLCVLRNLTAGTVDLYETAYTSLKRVAAAAPGQTVDRALLHQEMRPTLKLLSDVENLNRSTLKRLLYVTRLSPATFNEKFCDQMLIHLRQLMEKITKQPPSVRGTVDYVTQILEHTPAAGAKYIEPIVQNVTDAESQIGLESGSPWREPMAKFLLRYPLEALNYFLTEASIRSTAHREFFLCVIRRPDATGLRDRLRQSNELLPELFTSRVVASSSGGSMVHCGAAAQRDVELVALRLVNVLSAKACQADNADAGRRLSEVALDHVRRLWNSQPFYERYVNDSPEVGKFVVPRLAARFLLDCFRREPHKIDLLFEIVHCFARKPPAADFSFVRVFLENEVVQNYPIQWRRDMFKRFVHLYKTEEKLHDMVRVTFVLKLLQYIVIPCVAYSFEQGDIDSLLGTRPAPEEEANDSDNLVSLFISDVILDSKSNSSLPDGIQLLLYQLCALFVEHAPAHIHAAKTKRHETRLRNIMVFVWPCLQANGQHDPTIKYHGHLLLAHIIDKFNINRKIVLQVFSSLLRAHGQEPRAVIRQALSVLIPAVPQRMQDGHSELANHVKTFIVTDGHSVNQLLHLLNLIVRHHKVYFPVRHELVHYMMTGVTKLVLSGQSSMDSRKLAIDVCEMIIKWELYRIREKTEQGTSDGSGQSNKRNDTELSLSPSTDGARKSDKKEQKETSDKGADNEPIAKQFAEQVISMLIKLASHPPETSSQISSSSVDAMNKKCMQLLKVALKPEVWGRAVTVNLSWVDKALAAFEQQHRENSGAGTSQTQMQTYLDLLSYLALVVPKEFIPSTFAQVQRGIGCALQCASPQTVRSLFSLLARLMSVTECDDTGLNDLPKLNESIQKYVHSILAQFDRSPNCPIASLYGAMTVLKAVCGAKPAYLDNCPLAELMRALLKLTKEHCNDASKPAADVLSACFDLLRPRLHTLQPELAKMLNGPIMLTLIEKSNSARVLKSLVGLVHEWVHISLKNPKQLTTSGLPKERATLLLKLQEALLPDNSTVSPKSDVGSNFTESEHSEILELYLNAIETVYDSTVILVTSRDLVSRLEPSFFAGLLHSNTALSEKFFEIMHSTLSKNPYERLWHIMAMQNWAHCKRVFWLNLCTRLMLCCCDEDQLIRLLGTGASGIPGFASLLKVGGGVRGPDVDWLTRGVVKMEVQAETSAGEPDRKPTVQQLENIVEKQKMFLSDCISLKSRDIVGALSELCRQSDQLSRVVWKSLVASLWSTLSSEQRDCLSHEITPFMTSGAHVAQGMQGGDSVIATFLDTILACRPQISVKPSMIKHIGRWHARQQRGILALESHVNCLASPAIARRLWSPPEVLRDGYASVKCEGILPEFDGDARMEEEYLETLDSLIHLYIDLDEFDLLRAAWRTRAKLPSITSKCLSLSQFGNFDKSLVVAEGALGAVGDKFHAEAGESGATSDWPVNLWNYGETRVWLSEWVESVKQTNQWETLRHFANSTQIGDPLLLADGAWRSADTKLLVDSLNVAENSCTPDRRWQYHLLRGYSLVMQQGDISAPSGGGAQRPSAADQCSQVQTCVENATDLLIDRWRRLPAIIDYAHVPILQNAHRVQELTEAQQVGATIGTSGQQMNNQTLGQLISDIKSIIKTWRNRAPVASDPMSHWLDVHTWRLLHYAMVLKLFESGAVGAGGQQGADAHSSNQMLLPTHSCAQCFVAMSKVARKKHHWNVASDLLARLHCIPNLPVLDGYSKLYQQAKCCLHEGDVVAVSHADVRNGSLDVLRVDGAKNKWLEGLDLIDSAVLTHFSKDNNARLLSLKGTLCSRLSRPEDASRSFSTALQLSDVTHAWAAWAEHLQKIFDHNCEISPGAPESASVGVEALVCSLEAARAESEPKARRHMGRAVHILTKLCELTADARVVAASPVGLAADRRAVLAGLRKEIYVKVLDRFPGQSPVLNWVVWLPQLVSLVEKYGWTSLANVIASVARFHPQLVFQQLRPMFNENCDWRTQNVHEDKELSLGSIFNRTLHSVNLPLAEPSADQPSTSTAADGSQLSDAMNAKLLLAANEHAAVKCGAATGGEHELAKPLFASLLRQMLAVYPSEVLAMETVFVEMSKLSEHWSCAALHAVRTALVATQDAAMGQLIASGSAHFSNEISDDVKACASRVVDTLRNEKCEIGGTMLDVEFSSMRESMANDLNVELGQARKLTVFMSVLAKWEKLLAIRVDQLKDWWQLRDVSGYLSEFSGQLACLHVPTEISPSKHVPEIVLFNGRVKLVRHSTKTFLRLSVRAHNGKKYTIDIERMQKPEVDRAQCLEHFFQSFNLLLAKEPESSRRLLRVVSRHRVALNHDRSLVPGNRTAAYASDIVANVLNEKGASIYDLIVRFYEKYSLAQTLLMPGQSVDREMIVKELGKSFVPVATMTTFCSHIYTNASDYFTFRKQLCNQLAMFAMMCRAFELPDIDPQDLLCRLNDGTIVWDGNGLNGKHRTSRPLLRLTRCIENFIGPFAIRGHMYAALVACSKAVVRGGGARTHVADWLRPLLTQLASGDTQLEKCLKAESVVKNSLIVCRELSQVEARNQEKTEVEKWILESLSMQTQSEMDPSYHPWF